MKEMFKRALSGSIYAAIMWIGTSYSENTFRILFTILAMISMYEMWLLRQGKNKILPFLYIIIPFVLIHKLVINNNNYQFDPSLILLILILTWTFDSFAYFIGVRFGRKKIMPSVSPKKSWEGFIGGFLFTLAVAYIIINYFEEFKSIEHVLAISLFLPFTATIGDFIESYYKREAGVKDSGKLIPGHGGILDRIDGLMITIPVIYFINLLLI